MFSDARYIIVVSFIFAGLFSSFAAIAKEYSFNASQLDGGGRDVDISLFEQGGQLSGSYPVDIILNGERVDSREMAFHQERDVDGKPVLKTCLTRSQLIRYGVKTNEYSGLFPIVSGMGFDDAALDLECARLSAIPQATETFQFYNQQLLLSIPQVALRPKLQGIAPQELWDDGIPAFLMNYNVNANRMEYRGNGASSSNVMYAQLEPGVNLGAWRLRNQTTWQKQGKQQGQWQAAYTYAERGLYDLKSRLTLGERYTPSDIFDSLPFRGVQLGSDDDMVPYNQRDFAPMVRGIARTQARVEVKQNGYIVYSTTVAPGPFDLSDLSASGSGDLQVTVFETDGLPQVFTIPYTTPAIALRQGYLKYNLMGGQYRPADSSIDHASVGQATVMYGLPWNLTTYGGLQWANHYQAAALGLGVSLGDFGAVSVDGIQAQGQKQEQDTTRGQSWRARYSKTFETTNTGFTLASYQYTTTGFNTLSEVLDSYRDTKRNTSDADSDWYTRRYRYHDDSGRTDNMDKRKSRTSLTLSQSLSEWGYLSFTGSRETYWKQSEHQDELTASYGTTIKGIYWSLNWSERKRASSYYGNGNGGQREQSFSLWVSVPLARWLGNNTYATYQQQSNTGQNTQYEVGLNGDGFDRRLNWDVRERMEPGSRDGNQGSSLMNLNWRGTYGEMKGGYGYSERSRTMNAGISGGMVVHRHGITLGQPLGQTTALIEAPGASGASVGGGPGVRTDYRGYTTLGYLSPYQENTITLDPRTLPQDADVPQTDMKVVPTAGAIMPARFVTRTGGKAVVTLTQSNGKPVPFGAVVSLIGQEQTQVGAGIAGDGGETYMTGLPEKGQLQARWGKEQQQQCLVDYRLPEEKGEAGVYTVKSVCH
ncbi:MAG: fimbria/pilus outer membrane usher protein [Hafnia sp.]